MSRPKIGKTASVTRQVRLPEDVADNFRAACEAVSKTESEVLRALVGRWLRSLDKINRLRKEIHK